MSVHTDPLALPDEDVPPLPQRPLPLEIKTATRTQHTALNRLITDRLRLCLPPNTQAPHLYATGLAVFGSIYTSFEREWQLSFRRGKTGTSRIEDILQTVLIPELLRTEKLKREMESMGLFINQIPLSGTALSTIQERQSAVRAAIRAKPHVVLAYAWVMYMALFNGGRSIRDALAAAGSEFWHVSKSPTDVEEGLHLILDERLHFWHFDSPNDGDDIKEDFKKRFGAAAAQLTTSERVDVVDEAVRIFAICHSMVDWLDTHVGSGRDPEQDPEESVLQQTTWYGCASSIIFASMLAVWEIVLSMFYYMLPNRTQHEVEVKTTTVKETEASTPKLL